MKFIAIFDGYWGKADTIEKAIDRAENYGATVRPDSHVIVFEVIDDDAYVNNSGILVYEPIIGTGSDETLEVFKGIMQHLVCLEMYERKAGSADTTDAMILKGNKSDIPIEILRNAQKMKLEDEEIRCS